VEVNAGIPMVYASVGSVREKIPLPLVSDGVNKFLSLLLAIETFSTGVVLIDEIENGFYYDRFETIWSTLLQFCKERNTQIFASTHSMECLTSFLPTIRNNEKDFSLLRMEREDGECSARVFNGRDFFSAIDQEFEVR